MCSKINLLKCEQGGSGGRGVS